MLKQALVAATGCLLSFTLSAQQAQWNTFGAGCAGTGTGSVCESFNTANTGPLNIQNLANEYAYGVNITADTVILGMRLWTASATSGTSTFMTCGLYLDTGAATATAATSAVTTGTMRVEGTTTPAWYEAYFSTPVAVTAGSTVWISQFDSGNVNVADVLAGTPAVVPTLWRRPAGGGGGWSVTGIVQNPIWELICLRGTELQTPLLTYHETPALGSTFEVLLRHAAPGQPGVLMLGVSNTTWLGLPLPFQSPVSPPGCNFLVSGEVFLPIPGVPLTSAEGTANMPIAVPNNAALVGVPLFNQWFNFDTTGWHASNAGTFTVGN